MSRTKKKAAAPDAAAKSLKKRAKELIRNHPKAFIGTIGFITALVLSHFDNSFAGSVAMLYLIADNAKKSGRADGNVYMRNGRIRGFTVPSLVRNAYTGFARSGLGLFSQGWNNLTDEQRLTWINASGVFISNRFGQPKEVSGKELYVKCNQQLLYVGAAPATSFVPDALVGVLDLINASADVSLAAMEVTFSDAPVETDVSLVIFATGPQRPGIYRPSQSKYRFIQSFAPAQASPASIWTAYVAKFGTPTAGSKIFIRAFKVSNLSGLRTAFQETNFIVAA